MSFTNYVEDRELDVFAYKIHLLAEALEQNNTTFKKFWEDRGLRIVLEENYADEDQLLNELLGGLKKWFQGKPGTATQKYNQSSTAPWSQSGQLGFAPETPGGEAPALPLGPESGAMAAGAQSQAGATPAGAMASAPAPAQTAQNPGQAMQSAAGGISPEQVNQVYQNVSQTAPQIKAAISAAIKPMVTAALRRKDGAGQVSFAVLNALDQKMGSVIDKIAANPEKHFNINRGGTAFGDAQKKRQLQQKRHQISAANAPNPASVEMPQPKPVQGFAQQAG